MHQVLTPDERTAIVATLTGAVAADSSPTDEQQRFLDALRTRVLALDEQPDPLTPEGAAAALPTPALRHLVCEGLIALELMHHPPSPALAANVRTYLAALGSAEVEQAVVRDAVAEARAQVAEDWSRIREPSVDEPSIDVDEHDVLAQIQALADCPPGSLGRSFADFYRRNGFALPVGHLSLVSHDFAHVLAGYRPTPEGELALQAMLVAATGGTRHFSGLLASLLLFEVGLLPFPDIEPKVAALDRPGATDLFADAIRRGIACGCDLQRLDHLALADRDLVELRDELHIPAPVDGPSTFVV